MKILSIDSTAVSASCAILSDSKIIARSFVNTSLTHSQTLMPMVEDMLKSAKTSLKDIDCIAINVGPGSFTGVRIGISAVKGMAFALDIPCIEVSTLECIMRGVVFPVGHYIVESVMDARCNQVYNAAFEVKDGMITRLTEDRAIKLDELKEEISAYRLPIVLAGDGAEISYNFLKDDNKNIIIANEAVRYQSAENTAIIAKELLKEGKTVTASELQAGYLRMPQAERELKNKQKNN
ncbi:MAG: tRNA (adenosine(37)-N6)-threonylcarbamoyltransferase complex dimerization subunit type 1 TsaB [Clostridia bacterium]|nr:tRNA (adenosine(37)-N6)-threonylcarbamoyltransferase complex dimerization subunit type 1 TsaB [Clostridia bacterium]